MSQGRVVSFDGLTRDNTLLSRPTMSLWWPAGHGQEIASSATGQVSTREVEAYVEAGIGPATKRAYRTDLAPFEAWGWTLPATDAPVANYLADHATVLKVLDLIRGVSPPSLSHARLWAAKIRRPVQLVRATMRGVRRARRATQHQAKPLLLDGPLGRDLRGQRASRLREAQWMEWRKSGL
jgi:hypothetical protein